MNSTSWQIVSYFSFRRRHLNNSLPTLICGMKSYHRKLFEFSTCHHRRRRGRRNQKGEGRRTPRDVKLTSLSRIPVNNLDEEEEWEINNRPTVQGTNSGIIIYHGLIPVSSQSSSNLHSVIIYQLIFDSRSLFLSASSPTWA